MRQSILQCGASNWLCSKYIVSAMWGSYYKVDQLYYKVGQLSKKRLVHLCDTRVNGNSCLLIRALCVESGIL